MTGTRDQQGIVIRVEEVKGYVFRSAGGYDFGVVIEVKDVN